jgi:hypothetical protein
MKQKGPTIGSCLPFTRGTPRAGATSRATGSGQHSRDVGLQMTNSPIRIAIAAASIFALGCVRLPPEHRIYPSRTIADLSAHRDYTPDVPGLQLTSVASMSFAIQGLHTNAWYDPSVLDGKARSYVASHNVDFDFTNTTASVWIYNSSSPFMAMLSYSSGFGSASLLIYVDRTGNIVNHDLGTAACGTSLHE